MIEWEAIVVKPPSVSCCELHYPQEFETEVREIFSELAKRGVVDLGVVKGNDIAFDGPASRGQRFITVYGPAGQCDKMLYFRFHKKEENS